ncbi:hypothetical protein [Mycobacterium sp. URHB0044]|jgi:hypothetical protein|uniref:hypothetical protein n=1 Tax=Mycobacterium sp. URHB0044 TaxID=1380386 RepID=UPI000688AD4F|nr:hypothetical protein [Mycobacterium sp. URHB0044]
MSITKGGRISVAAAALLLSAAQFGSGVALADPELPPSPDATEQSVDAPAPPPEGQVPDLGPGPYNVVYRARVDGVSRGATINYTIADDQVNTANPTMVPGRIFEATGVVSDVQKAGMQVSIQWPYSASLHCEILANDQIVAQADQFVAPRLTPQRNDPGYGVLSCGTVTNFPTGNTAPMDVPAPVEGAPPADPNAPVEPAPVA